MSGYGTRLEGTNYVVYKHGTDDMVLKGKHTGRYYRKMVTTKKVQIPDAQLSFDEADHNMLWHRSFAYLTTDGVRHGVSHVSWTDGLQRRYVHNEDDRLWCNCGKLEN